MIDTNIIIAHLGNTLPTKGAIFIDSLPAKISLITRIELLEWYNAPPAELAKVEQFVQNAFIYNLNEQITLKTIELRQLHRLKTPDALIAATALIFNLTLLTRNTKDFAEVKDLNLLNPFGM